MSHVVLVTGASSGLGMALSILLAQKGFCVYATMRNTENKMKLLNACKDKGVSLFVKALDVSKPQSVTKCVKEIIEKEGNIDYLINNAGVGYAKTTEETSEEEIQTVMDVNFMGVVRTTKAVLPYMRKANKGHIINVTSVGGLVGQPFNEIYCASKFAVEGYTESLASYVGPHFNIHFTMIEPGGMETNFFENIQKSKGIPELKNNQEYASLFNRYLAGFKNRHDDSTRNPAYQTASDVAHKIHDCIQMKTPPLRMRTSEWGNQFCELKTKADPTGNLLSESIFNSLL